MAARREGGIWIDDNGRPSIIVSNEDGSAVGGGLVDQNGDPFGTTANPVQVDTGIVTTLGLGTVISPTITISATPDYSDGDVVGGEIALAGALRTATSNGILQNILILDEADQKPDLTILLFNGNPAGTYTDNAALPDLSTDIGLLIAKIAVATADWKSLGTIAIYDPALPLSKVIQAGATNGDLYMVLVKGAGGGGNYAASTDLRMRLSFLWN